MRSDPYVWTHRPSRQDVEKLSSFVGDLNEAIGWVLVPGKYSFDKYVVESEYNKKHKIFSYNPLEGFFSPLDFTPVGAVSKAYKGVKAVNRGKQLISMGFSGYGRRKVKEGAVKIFTAVGSKITSLGGQSSPKTFTPLSDISKSRVDSSLPSKSKTRGKRKPNLYDPKPGEKCRPGYVRIDGRCVRRNSTLHKSLMNN